MALMLSEILFESMHEKIVCARVFLGECSGAKEELEEKTNKIHEISGMCN